MKLFRQGMLLLSAVLLLGLPFSVSAVTEGLFLDIFDEKGEAIGQMEVAPSVDDGVYVNEQMSGGGLSMDEYMESIASDLSNIKPMDGGYAVYFDLSAYAGSFSNDDELAEIGFDFVRNHGGLFYLRTYVAPWYDYNCLWIITSMSAEEAAEAKIEFDAAVDEALTGIKPGMTDAEQLLYLHDWLALHNTYDYSGGEYSHTAYGALVNKASVCQGYAFAFNHLAECLGFETAYAYSDSSDPIGAKQNHGWSAVRLGQTWYYVDVTHDDPSNDIGDYSVRHDHFLLSEEGIRRRQIGGYDRAFLVPEGAVADDSRYEGLFGRFPSSAVLPLNGRWYAASTPSGGVATLYEAVDPFDAASWRAVSAQSPGYAGYYQVNMVARQGDAVLFFTNKEVYRYRPSVGTTETVYTLPSDSSFLYFIGVEGDTLYMVANTGNGGFEELAHPLRPTVAQTESLDLNDDCKSDLLDAMKLMAVIRNGEALYGSNRTLADADGNGAINTQDLIALLMKLASGE